MNSAIFLGLGSNLGDRAGHLQAALAGLTAGGCEILRMSAIYETPPWGLEEQPPFYNAVVEVSYANGPMDLLSLAMEVETAIGRQRSLHWGPRVIDIDVLAFGELQLMGQRLVVPHPLLQQRAFVLVPWNEIAPAFVVPGLGKSVSDLTAALDAAERAAITPVGVLQLPA